MVISDRFIHRSSSPSCRMNISNLISFPHCRLLYSPMQLMPQGQINIKSNVEARYKCGKAKDGFLHLILMDGFNGIVGFTMVRPCPFITLLGMSCSCLVLGRRSTDDERQIQRWKNCCGKKGRWKNNLITKVKRANTTPDDRGVSPVIRQTLHHWAFELLELK